MTQEQTPSEGKLALHRGRFRVKELAQKRGITLDQLARDSQLKYSTVQNIWRNKVNNPRYDTLRAIAHVLQVRVEELEQPGPTEESIRTSDLVTL